MLELIRIIGTLPDNSAGNFILESKDIQDAVLEIRHTITGNTARKIIRLPGYRILKIGCVLNVRW